MNYYNIFFYIIRHRSDTVNATPAELKAQDFQVKGFNIIYFLPFPYNVFPNMLRQKYNQNQSIYFITFP